MDRWDCEGRSNVYHVQHLALTLGNQRCFEFLWLGPLAPSAMVEIYV